MNRIIACKILKLEFWMFKYFNNTVWDIKKSSHYSSWFRCFTTRCSQRRIGWLASSTIVDWNVHQQRVEGKPIENGLLENQNSLENFNALLDFPNFISIEVRKLQKELIKLLFYKT